MLCLVSELPNFLVILQHLLYKLITICFFSEFPVGNHDLSNICNFISKYLLWWAELGIQDIKKSMHGQCSRKLITF